MSDESTAADRLRSFASAAKIHMEMVKIEHLEAKDAKMGLGVLLLKEDKSGWVATQFEQDGFIDDILDLIEENKQLKEGK